MFFQRSDGSLINLNLIYSLNADEEKIYGSMGNHTLEFVTLVKADDFSGLSFLNKKHRKQAFAKGLVIFTRLMRKTGYKVALTSEREPNSYSISGIIKQHNIIYWEDFKTLFEKVIADEEEVQQIEERNGLS